MKRDFERVYLGVGSNLGDRKFYLERAKALTLRLPHTRFLRGSSALETEPVGGPPQGKFLNTAWEIETQLSPQALKEALLQIETQLGRKRSVPNAPREIDIDILFYGNQVIEEDGLQIPHPRLYERLFVLAPLAELIPDWTHPQLKKTVKELLHEIVGAAHENLS